MEVWHEVKWWEEEGLDEGRADSGRARVLILGWGVVALILVVAAVVAWWVVLR